MGMVSADEKKEKVWNIEYKKQFYAFSRLEVLQLREHVQIGGRGIEEGKESLA